MGRSFCQPHRQHPPNVCALSAGQARARVSEKQRRASEVPSREAVGVRFRHRAWARSVDDVPDLVREHEHRFAACGERVAGRDDSRGRGERSALVGCQRDPPAGVREFRQARIPHREAAALDRDRALRHGRGGG